MLCIFLPLPQEWREKSAIPSYLYLKPTKGALRNSDNLTSSLCHLEKSKGNRLSKEAFDGRAEREGYSRSGMYLHFCKESFPVGHVNATEGSQA